ncbi:hypothetical protein M5K25_026529 [Dendrobium thyrsiflorum]|uniref:Uncharacterized protein n=1 Tax=Dendrobium thyrsiflorum TaxID=117978 RepID=A0ABD0TY20_DENTH
MQKTINITPELAQPVDHQSNISTNLPTNPIPQVSGIRTTHEEGNETDRLVHLQTHKNVTNASELMMTPQLESIINEKIKIVISSEQVEKFVSKGRLYPAEYDQVPYPKGYSVPKFNTFNSNGNPEQHFIREFQNVRRVLGNSSPFKESFQEGRRAFIYIVSTKQDRCMADPDLDSGIVYDEQGFIHILHSTFFDVNLRLDHTVEEYVEREIKSQGIVLRLCLCLVNGVNKNMADSIQQTQNKEALFYGENNLMYVDAGSEVDSTLDGIWNSCNTVAN